MYIYIMRVWSHVMLNTGTQILALNINLILLYLGLQLTMISNY